VAAVSRRRPGPFTRANGVTRLHATVGPTSVVSPTVVSPGRDRRGHGVAGEADADDGLGGRISAVDGRQRAGEADRRLAQPPAIGAAAGDDHEVGSRLGERQ
jgi:hypothetical protein